MLRQEGVVGLKVQLNSHIDVCHILNPATKQPVKNGIENSVRIQIKTEQHAIKQMVANNSQKVKEMEL